MENREVIAVPTASGGTAFRMYAENSLERYRAESLFTKEPETIHWIDTMMSGDDIFLDVGANVGIYSLYAAFRHPGLRIYSVEPVLKNYNRLYENLKLNQFNQVVPLFIALSDRNHILPLYIKDMRSGGSGSQIGTNTDEHGERFEPLSEQQTLVFSLDRLIEDFEIPCPNHLKIDVDGNEEKIILGMRRTLRDPRLKSIVVELNRSVPGVESAMNAIRDAGFTTETELNRLENHSRVRRSQKSENVAENLFFVRA